MSNCFRRIIILVATVGLCNAAFSANNQIWLKQTFEGQFVSDGEWSRLRFKVEQDERFNENRIIDSETLILLGWQVNPYFSIYLGEHWTNERSQGKGRMRAEQRPTLDLCLTTPEFATLRLDFRSRFEYRDRHGSDAYMRYRERMTLKTSWSVTDFRFSPYASAEFFFSDKPGIDKRDLFDRTRTRVGLSFTPIPSCQNLSCNLYFMAQHDISNHASTWRPTNVYGFEVGWKF